jgi:WD40 repeat protein
VPGTVAAAGSLHACDQLALCRLPTRTPAAHNLPPSPPPELPPSSAEEDHRLTGHGGAVLALAVDDAARRLYSASTDAGVRVWDLEVGGRRWPAPGRGSGLLKGLRPASERPAVSARLSGGLVCRPNGPQHRMSPPHRGAAQTMQCVHTLRGHSKPVTQLRLAGGRLYTAAGGAIRIWDTGSLRMVGRIQTSLYSGGIRSLLVGGGQGGGSMGNPMGERRGVRQSTQ